MKHLLFCCVFFSLLSCTISADAQNQTKKWYFGNYAGLDFSTTPPTAVSSGSMLAYYSCATIADASGNLLFYTDGATVWNNQHQVMANGTGLMGSGSSNSSQGSIIVQRPGSSSQYYVFTTTNNWATTTGFYYSLVDMTLASGQGSVVTKNVNLFTGNNSGRVTATRHCNGVDIWVVTRDWGGSSSTNTVTNNFYSYLVTSAGVGTVPVVSQGAVYTYSNNWSWYDWGCMKISPNGQKLGLANYNNWSWNSNTNNSIFELWDFNNSTGVITNSLSLLSVNTWSNNYWGGWGCEFSPDGTKFYGGHFGSLNSHIVQFDLCAGTPSAVAGSAYTISSTGQVGSLQLAPDGKIYCAVWGSASLGVINSPNSSGAASSYSATGISLSPKSSYYSLPNFMSSYFIQRPTPTPFTYSVGNGNACWTASFTSMYNPSITVVGCAATGYSLNAVQWNFGDPASGSNNISTVQNPTHAYTGMGTYTVQLVLYYSCGGGTDTLKQIVNVTQPCISVVSNSITCASLGSATVTALGGLGPFSYTWTPSAQTSSAASGLSPGTYTIRVYDAGNNSSYTATVLFTSLIPLTGTLVHESSVTCHGASTASATVNNIAGGSPTQLYSWFNGSITYTNPLVTTLSAGIWSVSVVDALTGCSIKQSFLITQPPAQSLVTAAGSPSACAGTSVVLTGTNSGGTPFTTGAPYTYSWTAGPAGDTHTVSQATGGTYIYTLVSRDSYSCPVTSTISVDFIVNPTITVSNVTICPLKTGTLVASGATTYTWSNNQTGSTFTSAPLNNTQYSVMGTAAGCTAAATASILLYPLPVPQINSNSPVCNGKSLQMAAAGGQSYQWNGPAGFSSIQQTLSITPATVNHSGLYTATVTSVNGCTASTSVNLTVHPTPTLSASGSTVCSNGTMLLFSNSVPGASYLWSGPQSFTSAVQNPAVNNPAVARSGYYNVTVTSAQNCTNSGVAHVSVTLLPQPVATNNGPKCEGGTIQFTGSGGTGYYWTGPDGFTSSSPNPVLSNVPALADGVYTLQVTTGPCVNTVTNSLTIHPLPVPVASNNGPVCETKTLKLSASSTGTVISFNWAGPGVKQSGSDLTRDSSEMHFAGEYTVMVTDQFGCQNTAMTNAVVLANPVLSTTGATVCLNQSATVTVNGAVQYLWSGPEFFQSTLSQAVIPVVDVSRQGQYTVTGTAANGCTSVATAMVGTKSLPVPALKVYPSNTVCTSQSVTMQGEGGEKYEWFGPGGFNKTGQTIAYIAEHNGYAGIYTLEVSDAGGCHNQTTVQLIVNNLPQGSLLGNFSGCVPLCSDYRFESANALSSEWEINGRKTGGSSFTNCFNSAGSYIISGKLSDHVTGCSATQTFEVIVYDQPESDFSFSPESPVESMDPVTFINNSVAGEKPTFEWHLGDLEISDQRDLTFNFEKAGTYPVVLISRDAHGCSDTIIKAVVIREDISVFFPNAFTPNNDSRNDVFMPVVRGIKKGKLQIFDRWGTKVFDTGSLLDGWDGRYLGEDCKQDVYTWRMVATTTNGEQRFYEGHVTLIR